MATFDQSYLFDKIVRWSHTVGFGGNWFRMQIGAQLRVKAGSQSMASAMNMALARKWWAEYWRGPRGDTRSLCAPVRIRGYPTSVYI